MMFAQRLNVWQVSTGAIQAMNVGYVGVNGWHVRARLTSGNDRVAL
ncbi:hypothetical protein [Sphingobium fontiphilum]|nr:hypothetical protein [Sphingobium fontiphilum]